nr:hypothetical protein [Nocardia caishijiensis]
MPTDLVNNGLPIHIGAALLGHSNVQTIRGYVAVFSEDEDLLARKETKRLARIAPVELGLPFPR